MEIYNKEFLKFDTHEHMSKKKLGGGHRHYGTGCGSLYGTCGDNQTYHPQNMGGGHRHYGTGCGSLYGTCPEQQTNLGNGHEHFSNPQGCGKENHSNSLGCGKENHSNSLGCGKENHSNSLGCGKENHDGHQNIYGINKNESSNIPEAYDYHPDTYSSCHEN